VTLKYDVVIFGGGIAGISCAYNCARLNLKTLLVEKESYLGGCVTGGLVVPVMKSDASMLNNDFYNDLVDYASKLGAQHTYCDNNKGWFNPVIIQHVLDNMLRNVGCDIIYYSRPISYKSDNENITKVEIENKLLSLPIEAKYFVDATGDASFSKILNCKFWDDTEQKQPESLRFILGGVNLEAFSKFIEELDSDRNITTTHRGERYVHLSTAYTWDKNKNWALKPYFEKAITDGVLKDTDSAYFQLFTIAGMPNSVAFNCPRLRDYNNLDPLDYSLAISQARESILRLTEFCRRYLTGFETAYLAQIAPQIGERETKRVKCKYDFTVDDIINQKDFKTAVVHSNYPIDIHSNSKNESVLYKVCAYKLPIESLMSVDYNNLYAIGKIAGTDFRAQAALRVQSSCMSMGEGVAKNI